MKKITGKQFEVLAFINSYMDDAGYPPSFAEIGNHFSFAPKCAYDHIHSLLKKDMVTLKPGIPRSLRLTEKGKCTLAGNVREKILCMEINDWVQYPAFFNEWFDWGSDKHEGKNWMKDMDAYAKKNRLCVKVVSVDMSISLLITAPESWVRENLPELKEKRWQDYCVFKYPQPFVNDSVKLLGPGPRAREDENHERERRRLLDLLHRQFSDKEIGNFKPHNILGAPSGEVFLDWLPENYGAREYEDGKVLEAD